MTLNTMGLPLYMTITIVNFASPVQDQVPVLQMGGLERKILLHRDSNQCPLGYEPRLYQLNHSLPTVCTQLYKLCTCSVSVHTT